MWKKIKKFLGFDKNHADVNYDWKYGTCGLCGRIVRDEDLIIDRFPTLYSDSYFLPQLFLACSGCIKDKDKTLIRVGLEGYVISITKEVDIKNSLKDKAVLDLRYYR